MIGTRLGDRYEISGELGRGGMGVVYRARDPLLNREVAVKLVAPSLLNAQSEERFQREAQLVAQMDHPAIVPIYDIGRHEGSLYFLMPVVRGNNLRAFLREKNRSIGELIDIAIQVADGLDYSHARGVIHRDVKPENLMVSEEDGSIRVRVMDFGLAKASSENRLTKTGTLVGTVSYFSPEQVVAREVDHRSDIYSLGVVLYESLNGEPPFSGETQAILYRIVHENPRSLRSLGAAIGEELDAIVLKCLAKDPGRRFQRASELADALRRYQSRLQDSERGNPIVLSNMMTAQFQRPPATQFIGREKEVAQLQHRLNAAVDGEAQFAVIAGEPGVGKTRLVEEIENLAKARGLRVLRGRFIEQDRAFSYQAFIEMIQEYFRVRSDTGGSGEHADFSDLAHDLILHFPPLSEIAELRASSGTRTTAGTEPRKADDRTYVFELLARTLARIGGGRALVLVFENLHGAEMSLDALAYVVRRLGPTPTLVIGTFRQTEVDKRHPLVKLLDGFSDDPRFVSMYIGPFSRSEHRQFVEMLVGSEALGSGFAETLYDATEANPFFTKELVRSLVDSGGIAKTETGEWSLSGEMGITSDNLPATIQQAVEKRIERLTDEVRDILSIASVIGKSFDFRDLELLADAKGEVEDLVEKLIADGILEEERESRGDRLTFASGIVRDVLYGALSRRKRKTLHRRYAEQLEARFAGKLERVFPQLLHHYSEGDVPEKSVEYGMSIARKSLEAFSAEEAVRVLKIVLEFVADDEWDGDATLAPEARLLLASAHRLLGNVDLALREADIAARAFDALGRKQRSAHALLLAAETAWQGRRVDDTRRWLSQGLIVARGGDDPEVVVRLLSLAATVANLRGEYAKAKEFLDEIGRSGIVHPETADDAIRAGGRLVAALVNPVAAREPAEVKVVEEGEVLALVFETLVTTDEQGHVIPLLAEKWDVIGDGRSLVFTIRRGAVFHDGAPVTAGDVKRSFERTIRIRGQQLPGAFSVVAGVQAFRDGAADDVSGFVVRGDSELEVQIADPLPIYPSLLNDPVTAVARVTAEGEPVGSGQFRFRDHQRDHLIVERNPQHWRETQARLDEIEFRVVGNASAIAAGLRAGTIDLGRDLLPDDVDSITRDPRFREGFFEVAKKATYFALFNAASPFGSNAALRHALFNVVRVHDLVWRSIGRLAQPAVGLIPPGILGHDAGRKRLTISREQAVDLLRESGVATPIHLRVAVHPLLADRYRAVTDAIFEIWRELGVVIEFASTTMEGYLAAFSANEGIDLLVGRWNADYDDPDNFANGLFRSKSGIFSAYYSSPETDALFDEARTETRPAAREALYRRFETTAIESAVLLPLFHEIDYRIASRTVRGLHLRSTRPYVNYSEIGKVESVHDDGIATVRAGGGTIVVPITQPVEVIDPILARTAEESEIVSTVYETLTRCGEGAQIIPWLVSEFRAEDGGRRYRFRLRDDVRFHDGRRLTSRDVRYSWERGLLRADSVLRGSLTPIRGAQRLVSGESHDLEGFHILSAREFVVELDDPLAFFPAIISNPTAAIVPEGTETIAGDWRGGCVGTGPFRVVQFDRGRRLELERNPHYWRTGYPKCETLVFRFGLTADEIKTEFKAGRLSLAAELFPADVETFRHDPELISGFREVPRLSIYYAVFNSVHGPLADPELRRSLIEGVDIAGMVRRTLGRLALPAHGVIAPGLIGYTPAPVRVPMPGRAHARHELELKTAVHPLFFGQYSALAREISSVFAERGVKLNVANKSIEDFLSMQIEGNCDVCVGRWIGDYPDADTFVHGMLDSQEGILGNFLDHPELDRLSLAARTEIDPTARHTIYRQVEELVARDALLLPLFHEQVYRFARPEVEGLRLNFALPAVAYDELRIRG